MATAHKQQGGTLGFVLLVALVFVTTVLLGLLVLGPADPGGSRTVYRLERPSLPVEPQLPDPSKLVPQVV